MPPEQPPEIQQDPREAREQPEMEPTKTRDEPEVDESSRIREEPEMPEPNRPRQKPEVDERPRRERKDSGVTPGPSSDVGGPRGIERGVGIETGEEAGGSDSSKKKR